MGWSDDKLKEVENNPNPEAALHKLWDLLSNGDNFAFPENMVNLCTYDLLNRRDLSMLFYRYINTDIATKNLSLAVQYKKQTVDFSLNDGREKIEKVLMTSGVGKRISIVATGGAPCVVIKKLPDDKSNLSAGERFMNSRSSPDDVATMLRMIQSGGAEKFMSFNRDEISTDRGRP